MGSDWRKTATIIFGSIMALAMAATVVLPILGQGVGHSVTRNVAGDVDTNTQNHNAVPDLPPPVTDFDAIVIDETFLHPTGLFTIAQPDGWIIPGNAPGDRPGTAEVSLNNAENLSVIQATVQTPPQPITTTEELDAYYDPGLLNSSWTAFARWSELERRFVGDNLEIDFQLENVRGQSFIARQVSWADGDWVNSVRVVAPENQSELLRFLVDTVTPTLRTNHIFAGTPTDWPVYYDEQSNHVIRYPLDWAVTDSAPGRPASFSGLDDVALRVEAESNSVLSNEAAVRDWVQNGHNGANILSVAPIERGGIPGYSVAYSFTDLDGEAQSGLAVLLNGPDDTLHVADLSFFAPSVDLNVTEGEFADLSQVMRTFSLFEMGE